MLKKSALACLGFFLFFSIWEWAAHLLPSLLFVLPAPTNILAAFWESKGRLLFHTLVTFKEMAGGFLLALSIAFPLAWIMLRSQISRMMLQPFFIIIQCLPMFTLAPIMVIWFGWSYTAIMIPTALMIFFPLTLSIYQGLRSTPQELLDFFRTNQATSLQTLIKLRLPFAMPHIFAGFRISAAIAGVGAVAGEWAGAENGLGILMLESRRNADLEICFAALFCLTLMSFMLYGLILGCERSFLQPRRSTSPSLPKSPPAKKRRLVFACFFIGLILFGLSSCQKKDPPPTRLLLDWLPNPNHVPLYVGVEKGYFAEENITLKLQKMHDSGSGISYLTSHQADLLLSHMPSVLKACHRGGDLKIVGSLIKQPLCCLIFRKDTEISQPSHLSGKILGYCLGSTDTSFVDYILREIHPKKKCNVNIDLVTAMGTKSVDFIFGGFWNIEPAQLKSLGIETDYFPVENFGVPTYYEIMVVANNHSKASDPDFILRFQRGLQKSIDYCKSNPTKALDVYFRQNPDKRKKTTLWEQEAWETTYPLLADNQEIDIEVLASFYRWLLEEGFVRNSFDYQALIPHNLTSIR